MRRFFYFSIIGVVLLSHQNCAKVSYSDAISTSAQLTDGGVDNTESTPLKVKNISIDTSSRYPTDVLFVLDESVSMNNVKSMVTAGFLSVSPSLFPDDTRIAVTNMAPAKVDSQFNILFNESFAKLDFIPKQPGFMKLVTKASLDSFKTNYPTYASRFPVSGCDQSWFKPTDLDQNGVHCLEGATQIALLGIGTEAGSVSLKQMVLNATKQSQVLFRKNTILNVIFVSDTHDPGSTYYGQPGGEASIPTTDSLISVIKANQPELTGVIFSGVLPLPMASNPVLANVTTLGNLPQTSAEEKVSTEGVYGYSYLNFIRDTGGIAMHLGNTDWTNIMKKLIERMGYLEKPIVTLDDAVNEIADVKVNDESLSPTEYSLQGDQKTLIINRRSGWPSQLSIVVSYK